MAMAKIQREHKAHRSMVQFHLLCMTIYGLVGQESLYYTVHNHVSNICGYVPHNRLCVQE